MISWLDPRLSDAGGMTSAAPAMRRVCTGEDAGASDIFARPSGVEQRVLSA
jgi:hypothetical protein